MDDGFYLDDKAIKHGYNSFRPNSTWTLSGAMGNSTKEISAAVAENAFPLSAKSVVDRVPKGAEWVLIGEASHGTREFYDMRAGKQYSPDAFRANLWVRGLSQDSSANEALADFKAAGGSRQEKQQKTVGFYGLDVYSLSASTQAVVDYLDRVSPEAAKAARERYSCFDRYGADAAMYGLALRHGAGVSCKDAAVKELVDLLKLVRQRMPQTAGRPEEAECDFAAQANAMVIKSAERYYRNMFFQDDITWNIRDKHMVDTALALKEHLKRYGTPTPKIVIWAHNSHLGDARATDMGIRRGEVNVGQLMLEHVGDRHTDLIASLGFTTHTGTVAAADDWNEPVKNMRVNPSLPASYENIMHAMARPAFGLQLTAAHGGARDISDVEALRAVRACLEGPRLERAIGVTYRPNTERFSHYFQTYLPEQFDIVMHIDKTSAVTPLDPGAHFEKAKQHPDLPETYPFAV
ncbi:hypothetical protein CVIRNUC_004868 [Coccomyxa viridis]|uniref:Erythromycin esterase n=1 Tax=Coccomyxa viridis TaxID=1274662 RepID=A0AAV1I5B8_9CHLO|nr:hypothetical protein CVIRNUC_004868 [Coccomyxa viridis]